MSNEIVKRDGAELYKVATDAAGLCKQIVVKTAVQIQGKKYVRVEGWQAIATAHGCILSARDVDALETGWRAIGEVRRISDGAVLATAEGFVGKDEKKWGSSQEYACRAMCQTRAMSRAARSAFAHVVVLIDANLSTTPYEEVPADGFQDEKRPQARPAPPKQIDGEIIDEPGPMPPMKRGSDLEEKLNQELEAPTQQNGSESIDVVSVGRQPNGQYRIAAKDGRDFYTKSKTAATNAMRAKQTNAKFTLSKDCVPDGGE